jgi:cell fate (sporulation/competence/biofilm development) regulator YlbF (YheA/YmcA/DUF963 family)
MPQDIKDPLDIAAQLRTVAQEIDDRPNEEIEALLNGAADLIVILQRIAMMTASAISEAIHGDNAPLSKPH